MRKRFYWLSGVSFIFTLIALVYYQANRPPAVYVQNQQEYGAAQIGGDFELVDQHGKVRASKEFLGKFMLVYFGYSFCPDICPMALENITGALKLLQRDRDQVVPIFITIDPERDTVENLKLYASNFSPNVIMLSGAKDSIAKAMSAYKVYGKKNVKDATLIDHSTIIYLMDRNGKFLQHFPHTVEPSILARAIEGHLSPIKK